MKKPKETAAIRTYADHEVILPPNKLKKAVVRVKHNESSVVDPVTRAEQALAELSSEFSGWMERDLARLDEMRRAVKDNGFTGANRDAFFRAAHDIKGEAATFGYPQAAPVADSLCRLIEHCPEPARIPMMLIDQHVDGIRAIVMRNAHGNTQEKAQALASRLRQVTDEFLAHENRNRPDYLDGIFAPPIAPGTGE